MAEFRLSSSCGSTDDQPLGGGSDDDLRLRRGLINQVAHANGVIWSQLADPTRMARPGGFTSTLNGATLWNTGSYAYDGAGNVTRVGSSYYLYDNVSRIGTASFSTLALDGGTPTVQNYAYDPFGNLN